MKQFSLHELACFDAVATEGGFHAAADKLHRSHPSVYTAIKNLEEHLGLTLFDRSNYRVALSVEGKAFHARSRSLLRDAGMLHAYAAHLAAGEESDLRIAVGSLCSPAMTAAIFRDFSAASNISRTRLHFSPEAVSGAWERLFDNEVDLILSPIDLRDSRFESVGLFTVDMIPVVAPGFLDFPISARISPADMRGHVQCVLRDSSRKGSSQNYFLIEGANNWTVADQPMKRELIVHGMAWGHMPRHMIEAELNDGRLLSIEGEYFKSTAIEVAAARLRESSHGPIAERLWQFLASRDSAAVEV